jgi:hypothetical protein
MSIYFVLGLIILFALDGIFRDGQLLVAFVQKDFFMSTVVQMFLIVIGALATIMLFHSIIWDLNLLDKPEEKKTEHQLELEREAELEKEAAEQEKLEKERLAKAKKTR